MAHTQQLVIVRRNQFATFEMLAQSFAGEPSVRLVWDRRLRDRRTTSVSPEASERRRRDRRRDPSLTWGCNDYLLLNVVEPGQTPGPRTTPVGLEEQTQRDIDAAVRTDLAVLISGGDPITRKSLAYQIHHRTHGHNRPLINIDRDTLVDMFAADVNRGRQMLSQNSAGTLLFEEVGDLTWDQQTAMATFFEEREAMRNQLSASVPRIVSGTRYWLLDHVANHTFRADLFYRLNRVHLVLPSGSVVHARA